MGSDLADGADFITELLTEAPARSAAADPAPVLQFTIRRFILQILLEKAATVVPGQASAMPVLKNFRFELTPQRLRVVATDLELSMIATTDIVTVAVPGVAVFPARKLLSIVKEAEDTDVDIRVQAGTAHISIGRTGWRLKLQGGDDYPKLPEINDVVFTRVDRAGFAAALATVRYAAPSANRASLAMIDVRDGKMTACDGARFQQARMEHLPFGFRIPIGAVDDLTRLLKITDLEHIAIGESDHHLIVRFAADVFVIAKLVAQFPDQESMFLRPALGNKHTLTVDRQALLTAVKRVRINADQNTSAISLTVTDDHDGTLTVASRDQHGNHATETIEARWSGPTRTITVNHQFFTDLLAGYRQPSCQFKLGDDTKTRRSPVLLQDPEAGTTGVLHQMIIDWGS